jgi:hypothetical protein
MPDLNYKFGRTLMEAVVAGFSSHTPPTNDRRTMIIISKTSLNTARSRFKYDATGYQTNFEENIKLTVLRSGGSRSDDYEGDHLLGCVAVYMVDRY